MVDSQAKGKRAERDLVNYLKQVWPEARRHVRTGDLYSADEGDIRLDGSQGQGCVVIEVKHYAGGLTRTQVGAFLLKLETSQCRGTDLGVLIERREGSSNPADWYAHLTLATLEKLTRGATTMGSPGEVVVRLRAADAFELVRRYQNLIQARTADRLMDAVRNPYAAGLR
jgi:hypothetical protein